jgi:hypothetical protein
MSRQCFLAATILLAALVSSQAQTGSGFNDREKGISAELHNLRSLPDAQWAKTVGELARQIQRMRPVNTGHRP